MENQELVKKLISLIHLDIDAVHAYDQAIQKIDITEVQDQLRRFREDHDRHIRDLSPLIRQVGGQPPEYKADFKGFVLKGFTALRSITGTEGALKAMKTNENLTNSTYNDALLWDVPVNVMEVIRRNRDDEKRHLQYIEQTIENQVWKKAKRVA